MLEWTWPFRGSRISGASRHICRVHLKFLTLYTVIGHIFSGELLASTGDLRIKCSAPNSAAAGTRSATISCAPSSPCEPSANPRPSGQPPFLAGAAVGGRSSPVRCNVRQPARCWAGCGWPRLRPPVPRPLWQPCWTGLTLQPSAGCRCDSCLTRFTRSRATEPGWRIVAATEKKKINGFLEHVPSIASTSQSTN